MLLVVVVWLVNYVIVVDVYIGCGFDLGVVFVVCKVDFDIVIVVGEVLCVGML